MVAYHRSMLDPELLEGEVVKLHDCTKFRLFRAKLERKKQALFYDFDTI